MVESEIGFVYCFGSGNHYQLGTRKLLNESSPRRIISYHNIKQIKSSNNTNFALTDKGVLVGWGEDVGQTPHLLIPLSRNPIVWAISNYNQLIIRSERSCQVFQKIQNLHYYYAFYSNVSTNHKQIIGASCGVDHGLLLCADGSVVPYAENSKLLFGAPLKSAMQLYNGFTVSVVPINEKIVKVASGAYHNVVLSENGNVHVWGENKYGQLGVGDQIDHENVMKLNFPEMVDDIICGEYHTILITKKREAFVFGNNKSGQLGIGKDIEIVTTPHLLKLPDGGKIVKMSTGGADNCSHTIALTEYMNLFSWGSGRSGQLGHGDNIDYDTPQLIQAFKGKHIRDFCCGSQHTAVVVQERLVEFSDGDNFERKTKDPTLGSFEILPTDVIEMIVYNLDTFYLLNFGNCSQYLYSITHTNNIWKMRCFHQFPNLLEDMLFRAQIMKWNLVFKNTYIELFDREKPIQTLQMLPHTEKKGDYGLFSAITNFVGNTKSFFSKVEKRVVVLGLDEAGKTTILYQFKKEVVRTMPTIGYYIETTHVKDLTLISGDVGGADKLRPLWRHYFQNASGIIFVVDCRNHERLEQVAEELIRIFSEVVLNGVPFLIFANKQDLKGALTPYQLACELGLRNPLMNDPIQMESKIRNNLALHFEGRHWCIQPSCAISGVGLQEGIHWLASATHK